MHDFDESEDSRLSVNQNIGSSSLLTTMTVQEDTESYIVKL